MCFSMEASFTVSAALVPAWVYCTRAALRCRRRAFLLVAMIPLVFSVQQFSEGLVWVGMERHDPALVQSASLWFLFFALSFWPLWLPFTALCLEKHASQRRILAGITLLGLVWSCVIFGPLVWNPDDWLRTNVVEHSLQYSFPNAPAFRVWPQDFLRWCYVLIGAAALIICSRKDFQRFGMLLAGAAALSRIVFWYAFASVWCFFAALLSLYLCLLFRKLTATEPASGVTPHRPLPWPFSASSCRFFSSPHESAQIPSGPAPEHN